MPSIDMTDMIPAFRIEAVTTLKPPSTFSCILTVAGQYPISPVSISSLSLVLDNLVHEIVLTVS